MTARKSSTCRRVAIVTGTRAEYGALRSTCAAIAAHAKLELQIIAVGMHLLRKFGNTVRAIEADGFPIVARVPMQKGDDNAVDQARGLGKGVSGIAQALAEHDSDVVVVLGDRIEAMAGALAAVTTGRLLAHVHGGDIAAGDFDETLRHAITKLAHIHFPATRKAARRIIRLGEAGRRVHEVGAPGLDRLRELIAAAPPTTLRSDTALVVFHARGRAEEKEYRAMRNVLRAVADAGLKRVIVYPNTDRGHTGVVRAIDEHRELGPAYAVQVFRSLPRDDYLRALLGADMLIGNSSSGLIEAPFAGTVSINVGERQAGRDPGGRSILHCAESLPALRDAIGRARMRRTRRGAKTIYGDGRAGERIARVLARLREGVQLRDKRLPY